nr:hypothetical protein [uncultured Duganella sp.]
MLRLSFSREQRRRRSLWSDINMPKYIKKHWDQPRGDKHDEWGTSWWYFEIDEHGWASRQLVHYASGKMLRYSADHPADAFGELALTSLSSLEAECAKISADEFEALWQTAAHDKLARR